MPRFIRHAVVLSSLACMLAACSDARAASVVWTINTSATTMGISGTGKAPVNGLAVPLKIVSQGTTPLTNQTPTLAMKFGGQLITDTDFTSSITFLKTGTGIGLDVGNFTPDTTGENVSLPGNIGATILGKVGPLNNYPLANGVFRDMGYDISGATTPITNGNFAVNGLSLTIVGGNLDYRELNAVGIGSGRTELAARIPGDANYDRIVDGGDYTIWADNFQIATGANTFYKGDFNNDGLVDGGDYTLWADNFLKTDSDFPGTINAAVGSGTISISGNVATLTLPITAILAQILDDGDDDSSGTTDDISIDFKFAGTIVATAIIPSPSLAVPEPSTFALSLIAGLGLCGYGFRRKLSRGA